MPQARQVAIVSGSVVLAVPLRSNWLAAAWRWRSTTAALEWRRRPSPPKRALWASIACACRPTSPIRPRRAAWLARYTATEADYITGQQINVNGGVYMWQALEHEPQGERASIAGPAAYAASAPPP